MVDPIAFLVDLRIPGASSVLRGGLVTNNVCGLRQLNQRDAAARPLRMLRDRVWCIPLWRSTYLRHHAPEMAGGRRTLGANYLALETIYWFQMGSTYL